MMKFINISQLRVVYLPSKSKVEMELAFVSIKDRICAEGRFLTIAQWMGSLLRALKRNLEAYDHFTYHVITDNTIKTKITTEVIIAIVLAERIVDDGTMTIFGAIVGFEDGVAVGTGRPLIV